MHTPSAGSLVTPNVRLVRQLGEGGMGSVWLADHLALKTQVVVKFMATELSQNAEAISRFAREAAAASQVKSPHVVQMLDHGVMEGGPPYIVMEWLEGHDLDQHIAAHGAMSPQAAAEVIAQVSRALSRAHERGIVHRDIKPSNIFLCDAGDGRMFVKLLDFGIAKGLDNNMLDSDTRTGSVVGSPHYMSPEQVVGAKSIDHHTDLWSLGVVAFEAMTGHKPFEAETVGGLALKIHHEPLPLPTTTAPHVPKAVDAWFERACARDPAARFSSAKEMADALVVAVQGDVSMSLPAPSSNSSPRLVDLALAKTSVDAQTGPNSERALVAARSLTDAGVTRGTARPKSSLAWVGWAVAALAVIGGVSVIAFKSRDPNANATATPASTPAPTPTPTLSTLAPLTPSVVPVVSSVPVATSAPLHVTPHAPVPSASVSSAPAVSATVPPRPSASHDDNDIK